MNYVGRRLHKVLCSYHSDKFLKCSIVVIFVSLHTIRFDSGIAHNNQAIIDAESPTASGLTRLEY